MSPGRRTEDVRVRLATTWTGIGAASAVVLAPGVMASGAVETVHENAEGDATIGLVATSAGAVLAALMTVVGTVVLAFSSRSLAGDPQQRRFTALVGILVTASVVTATAATSLILAAGWVIASAAVVALVGLRRPWPAAVDAARRTRRAFLVGDAALIGAVLVGLAVADVHDLRDLGPATERLAAESLALGGVEVSALTAVGILLLVAGVCRSALVPMHRWLPGSIAAPTPVSALLHAGVVNGAGVLLLQFAPVAALSGATMWLAFALGIATVVIAGSAMMARVDAKGTLAWSTVGQMGFMTAQIGVGAFASALFHLVGHSLYKATLFLGVGGTVDARAESRHRSPATDPLAPALRHTIAVGAPAVVLTPLLAILDPAGSAAGTLLLGGFAWWSAARLLDGFLTQGAPTARPILSGLTLMAGWATLYLGGATIFKSLVGSSLPDAVPGAVGPTAVALAMVLIASVAVTVAAARRSGGAMWSARVYTLAHSLGAPPARRTRPTTAPVPSGAPPAPDSPTPSLATAGDRIAH